MLKFSNDISQYKFQSGQSVMFHIKLSKLPCNYVVSKNKRPNNETFKWLQLT